MEPWGEKIEYVVENTEVLMPPKQALITFGSTTVHYYLVTEPVYAEPSGIGDETVIREGKVIAERPKIVTPSYLVNLFQGFMHGKEYAEFVMREYGPHEPGLLYRYKNELSSTDIVSEPLSEVAAKLIAKLEWERELLAAVIKGVDEMWDVSLMKFIHDFTANSFRDNVAELHGKGFLDVDDSHIPRGVRIRIEEIFDQVWKGQRQPQELKLELERWGLFREYEDRFLSLFRRR
jgi:hypothetical protein